MNLIEITLIIIALFFIIHNVITIIGLTMLYRSRVRMYKKLLDYTKEKDKSNPNETK